MNNYSRNVRIIARNSESDSIFDIFIKAHGVEHYVMSHRFNAHIFEALRKEVTLKDFEHLKKKLVSTIAMEGRGYGKRKSRTQRNMRNYSSHIENSLNHIFMIVEEYLQYEYKQTPHEDYIGNHLYAYV